MNEESIFAAAIEKRSASERDAFLQEACRGDRALQGRLAGLLKAYDEPDSFLAGPATNAAEPGLGAAFARNATVDARVGSTIGRYKLLEQIGEGGMGIVFVAEQTEPVRRRVALKIIKPGMDTAQVIARFEAERQALAMMDHPNIARVLDAGTTDAGRPYFAMELVRGMPITEYCDKVKLSPRQRLQLFVHVCQAVQHAHQKGIIHRDLKPSNVLITLHDGTPVVKVIDFGVAKAVGHQLTERTLYTALTQLVGTPLYMSPEQAEMSGLDVDTRSDVYSLGVLLYELLTGQTPFDKEALSKAGLDEMRRIIREDDPPRPSRRFSTLGAQAISTVSQHRSVDERRLSKILNGELDWIVMKSLEKDRTRRYESASSLAADIQRYLSDEPVLACPPTAMYRFQKFARKHRPALVTVAAIALCLLLGTTVSAWQAVRATTAEAQANANEQKAIANEAQAKEAAAAEAQQRQRAEANEQKANTQRDEAQRQRDEVKALNDKLQRTLYAAHVNLAQHAWDKNVTSRTLELLNQHRPKPNESDLRGFEWHYLYRLCHTELFTVKVANEFLRSVSYSPDGKRLITRARSGEIKVWDAQTGQELVAPELKPAPGSHSPDGRYLATSIWDQATDESTTKIVDSQSGKELHTFTKQKGWSEGLLFSPDSKHLASVSARVDNQQSRFLPGDLKVWETATGRELFSVSVGGHSLAYHPDGKRLAVASSANRIRIYDAQAGNELLSIPGGGEYMVTYSPDGKRLAGPDSGSDDETVLRIWNAETGEVLRTLKGHANRSIHRVTFSPDGKTLASASSDRTAKLWDAETGEELAAFKGHANVVSSVAFNPEGSRLASASLDGTVRVWDVSRAQKGPAFSNPSTSISCVAFSTDGKRLATGGGIWDEAKQDYVSGMLTVWDRHSAHEILSLKDLKTAVRHVAFSPDGKRLASASDDKTLRVWDVQSGKELFSHQVQDERRTPIAFSPDGKHLASTSDPNTVKIWDADTGREIFSLQKTQVNPDRRGGGPATGLAYSPDGTRLFSTSRGGLIAWNARTGEVIHSLQGRPSQNSAALAISPDGTRLATSRNVGPGGFGDVVVWDSQSGQELLTLKGHTASISSIVYSPDGKRLISTSGNPTSGNTGEVKVWDADSGLELLTIPGGGYGHRIAISPDGCWLACCVRGTLRIWDAAPLPEKP